MVAPEREVVLCGDGPLATIQIVEFEKQNAKNKNAKSVSFPSENFVFL